MYEGSFYGAGSLGAVDFFSYGESNTYYVDNIIYKQDILGTQDPNSGKLVHFIQDQKLYIKNNSVLQSLVIYNSSGQIVNVYNPNHKNYDIDLSKLVSGVYYIKGIAGKNEFSFKIIK